MRNKCPFGIKIKRSENSNFFISHRGTEYPGRQVDPKGHPPSKMGKNANISNLTTN